MHTKPSIINSSQRSCSLINSIQKNSQLNLQIYIYGNKPKAFHYNQLTQHYIYFKYYFRLHLNLDDIKRTSTALITSAMRKF